MNTTPVPRERRRHVVRLVRRVGLHAASLSDDARLAYVVGALVADSRGHVTQEQLAEACGDPKLVALAANILTVTAIDTAAL